MLRPPPISTLFPYTTLFRSNDVSQRGPQRGVAGMTVPSRIAGEPIGDPLSAAHCIDGDPRDRKSTRLNSSHVRISYAVFCLKKKKRKRITLNPAPLNTID